MVAETLVHDVTSPRATGPVPAGVLSAQRALRLTGIPIVAFVFWIIGLMSDPGDAVAWLALVALAWYLFNLGLAWTLGRGSRFGRGATWVAMIVQMPFYFLTDLIIILVIFNTSKHLADNMLGSIAIAGYTVMVILVLLGLAKPSGNFFVKGTAPRVSQPSR